MLVYRVRNIVIAIGLALLAMMLTLFYVTNYKRSVQGEAKSVQVYVAARDIPAGVSGTELERDHGLRLASVARRNVVPGAISSPEQIAGQVLAAPLYAGEQVTSRRFTDVAAQGIRSQLKGTMRAVQVAGDTNQLLAGTLHAGDHVDVVANLRIDTNRIANATRIVLRDLTVLGGADLSTTTRVSSGAATSVLLAVTDTQVQRLFYVLKNADWTLQLRPVIGASDSRERIETLDSVLKEGVK
jgi:Flp pilus assembly protein CpaB